MAPDGRDSLKAATSVYILPFVSEHDHFTVFFQEVLEDDLEPVALVILRLVDQDGRVLREVAAHGVEEIRVII